MNTQKPTKNNNMNTLENFLKKHNACRDGFEFAKDLTLEQFLETCQRGDWILWLFARTNPDSLREIALAKGHCSNTIRHLMKDERSLKAVDTAIAFGEGKATREELKVAANAIVNAIDADAAAFAAAFAAADVDAFAAADAAFAAADAAFADAFADASVAAAYAAARKQNQKQTADICRKYLPLEIWNQNEI